MPRLTPIKDFLMRLQVDSDFVKTILDPDPQKQADAFGEYGLDVDTRNAIVGPTPIKDFLFRLEVDADFVNRVLDPQQVDAALVELGLDEATRTAIKTAIGTRDFRQLEQLVQAEDPDADTAHILPRAWVR